MEKAALGSPAAAVAPLIYSAAVPTPAGAASMLHAGCPVDTCDAPHESGGISPTAPNSVCASGFCYTSDTGPRCASAEVCLADGQEAQNCNNANDPCCGGICTGPPFNCDVLPC